MNGTRSAAHRLAESRRFVKDGSQAPRTIARKQFGGTCGSCARRGSNPDRMPAVTGRAAAVRAAAAEWPAGRAGVPGPPASEVVSRRCVTGLRLRQPEGKAARDEGPFRFCVCGIGAVKNTEGKARRGQAGPDAAFPRERGKDLL